MATPRTDRPGESLPIHHISSVCSLAAVSVGRLTGPDPDHDSATMSPAANIEHRQFLEQDKLLSNL